MTSRINICETPFVQNDSELPKPTGRVIRFKETR